MPRILVIEDEANIRKLVEANLTTSGYIERELPDLIILDLMMPKVDGFEVLRRLREWSQVPIIMLSARGDVQDKVKCLDSGADDYISKPFGVGELLSRVRVVLRRTQAISAVPRQPSFACGDLEINFAQRRVAVSGKEAKLTPTEYSLLQELVLNAGKVLTYTHLLHKIWGPEYQDEKEYLHVFTGRLRAKLEPDPANPRYIATVPGVGYQFKS